MYDWLWDDESAYNGGIELPPELAAQWPGFETPFWMEEIGGVPGYPEFELPPQLRPQLPPYWEELEPLREPTFLPPPPAEITYPELELPPQFAPQPPGYLPQPAIPTARPKTSLWDLISGGTSAIGPAARQPSAQPAAGALLRAPAAQSTPTITIALIVIAFLVLR